MKYLFVVAIVGASMVTGASAGERVNDMALGAASGALVGGPVGLVAGGVIGYVAGPDIGRGLGFRHNRSDRSRTPPVRHNEKPGAQLDGETSPDAR
jgi:hypothetical protein